MDVLEFLDETGSVLVKRIPDEGQLVIEWGSQMTVRESQDAVFFRDGKALDVFSAGRHILETQNIPVITKWVTSFGYGPNNPFRAEVLFVGKQVFANLKWGTKEPILFRDSEFEIVRLRSYGSFSIQIKDSLLFVNKIVGTMGLYNTNQIEDYLRGIIISKLNVVLGKTLKTILDFPTLFDQINLIMRLELQADFDGLGLTLYDFYIQSISMPEDVQKMIDIKTGMNAIGNLDQYMKFKIANSLTESAKNNNSMGSLIGIGAGLGVGMNVSDTIKQSLNSNISVNPTEMLKKIKELLDINAITIEEYEEKKKELLKQF